MAEPSVSVILPVFNGERYILDAITSVLEQTYQQLELIVVDDGSTDSTAARISSVQSSNMRYVKQANRGAGAARNTGVELASGEFLAFLDADDLWPEDKLAVQVEMLQKDCDLDMVFGCYTEFISPELVTAVQPDSDPLPAYSSGTMLIWHESFSRIGGFSTQWRVGEFIDWYARAMDEGLKAKMLPHVLLRRRIHTENAGVRERDSRQNYAEVVRAIIQRRRALE